MVLKIAITMLVVIAVLLVLAATRSSSFQVQRSITIHASQERVFSFINDLHLWEAWSANDTGQGSVPKNYSGSATGMGAVAEWNGSGREGAAKMVITESTAPSKVSVKVDWVRPFVAHNLNEFAIASKGDNTEVTWSIEASNSYVMKVIGVFVDMRSEFGKHMEVGLAKLKGVAEKKE
jgi:Polyketide cyclase / dehydrase and lipid transport